MSKLFAAFCTTPLVADPGCRVVAVIVVSFVSQGLSSIGNERWVCYSAVSTAGVVSLLPGFLIRTSPTIVCHQRIRSNPLRSLSVSSSQEIAAKHAMSGSVKMVYAVVYSLFLVSCMALAHVAQTLMNVFRASR